MKYPSLRTIIFFFLLTALPLSAACRVIFIPGWYSEWIHYSKHMQQLEQCFPDTDAKVYKWNSNRIWKNAKVSASECAVALARELENSSDREEIILIGHSLGGRIVIDCAEKLSAQNLRVRQVILLGCAGTVDENKLAALQKFSIRPVINIFCLEDNMLKLYIGKENEIPLGFAGVARKQKNFKQFRLHAPDNDLKVGKVTIISADTLELARETAIHLSVNYLALLHQALNGSTAEYYLDYAALEAVAAEKSSAPDKIPGFRETDSFDGWSLEKRSWKSRFRITAPSGREFYYDNETAAAATFAQIKQCLMAKKGEEK